MEASLILTPEKNSRLQEIGKEYNLRFIVVHGSYAKGTPHEGSDLDIAILGKQSISFDELMNIHGELGSVFGDNEERELDLKTLNSVDTLFRFHVVRDGKLLYGDTTDYNEYKAYAYRSYVDSKDLRFLEELLLRKSITAIDKRYAR